MSNSVRLEVERTSAGLTGLLRDFGWKDEPQPNYADVIADPQTAHIGSARTRRARAMSLLGSGEGQLRLANIMSILRDHNPTGQCEIEWDPSSTLKHDLCIHAGPDDRGTQTTAAMASEIRPKDSVHWVTGTAAPCISIFKPVLMDVPLPAHGPRPTDRFDANAWWWRHERLHRAALMGHFPKFLDEVRQERDALEAGFHARVKAVLNGGSVAERSQVVAECWNEAIETEDRWFVRLGRTIPPGTLPIMPLGQK